MVSPFPDIGHCTVLIGLWLWTPSSMEPPSFRSILNITDSFSQDSRVLTWWEYSCFMHSSIFSRKSCKSHELSTSINRHCPLRTILEWTREGHPRMTVFRYAFGSVATGVSLRSYHQTTAVLSTAKPESNQKVIYVRFSFFKVVRRPLLIQRNSFTWKPLKYIRIWLFENRWEVCDIQIGNSRWPQERRMFATTHPDVTSLFRRNFCCLNRKPSIVNYLRLQGASGSSQETIADCHVFTSIRVFSYHLVRTNFHFRYLDWDQQPVWCASSPVFGNKASDDEWDDVVLDVFQLPRLLLRANLEPPSGVTCILC